VYTTDWTHYAATNGGQSEEVSLYDSNNILLSTTVVNESAPSVASASFTGIPKGTIRVVVQLYSGQNLTGTETGLLETYATVQGPTTVATAVGVTPTTMQLAPTSDTLTVPQNVRFVCTAYSASNVVTFLPVSDLSWQATGSAVNINASTGVVDAAAQGSSTVKATSSTYGLNATASVTVQSSSQVEAKWTILVYLNAANDLSPYSTLNVQQMQSVATNSNVNIVLQWKEATSVSPSLTFNGTRRCLVLHNATEVIQDLGTGVDMGSASTLANFISWAETYYPAERYALVVWDHGNGWERSALAGKTRAISYDEETGNAIEVWQLPTALAGAHFEMVAWDACLMQMMEIAYEIRSYTTFMVGSEEDQPADGYPYDKIFGQFESTPDADSSTLAKAFVTGMLNDSSYSSYKITQSVIQTSALDAVATAANSLAEALIANQSSLSAVIPEVRSATQAYDADEGYYYEDLYGLAANMNQMISITGIQTAAQSVESAVSAAVVWEGHNALSPGSHGLAIDFTPGATAGTSMLSDYSQMSFGQDTQWLNWLDICP
jgi:hypothetical protein